MKRHEQITELPSLVQEFAATLHSELDYLREGHSAERFAANFADDPTIHIPKVFWETTTERILTLERIRGSRSAIRSAVYHRLCDRVGARRLPGREYSPRETTRLNFLIRDAKIIPPTLQNQKTVENDLRRRSQPGGKTCH